MDRKRKGKNLFLRNRNNKIYMDLKDIIREHALPHLPAKSLCRFKSVCRDWNLQISGPFFAHSQTNTFRDISGFFCQSGQNPPSFISLDPNAYGVPDPALSFLPEPVDIRTSSNGLLCCQGFRGDKPYYICNPATKVWKKLPKPKAAHGSSPAIVLAFEPSLLNFVAEYKLVCAFPCADLDDGYEFDIYSSKEGTWRVSGEIYLGSKKLFPRSGVHINGIIYWKLTCGGIFLFDLTKERTQVIYDYNYSYHHEVRGFGTFGGLNGKLCSAKFMDQTLIVNVLSNSHRNTMGKELVNKSSTWTLKHQIHFKSLILSGHASIVLFAGGNCVLFHNGGKLYSCDMKTEEIKCLLAKVDNNFNITAAYVNSIVEI